MPECRGYVVMQRGRGCALTVTVRVPVGLAPLGEVMVPLTVTGAFAAGLVGVTVCEIVVGLVPPPPFTTRFVAALDVGEVAPVAAHTFVPPSHKAA